MSDKNPDLVALHQSLGDIVDALVVKQEVATDPQTIVAIDREIGEVVFRITNVQRALFKQQTAKISAAVAKVGDARADLDAAIAEIEKLNKFLRTISAFLGLVDKVIDLIKLV
jgi:hypothetical protein